jgi:hypothetical protein
MNSDETFKKLLREVLLAYEKMTKSLSFVHYDDDVYIINKFHQAMNVFVTHFDNRLSEDDFLDTIVECLEKAKKRIDITCPLFFIKMVMDIDNEKNRYNVIRYLVHKFPLEQIKEYKSHFKFIFKDPNIYMDYLDLFCDSKYEFLYEQLGKSGRHTNQLMLEYLNVARDRNEKREQVKSLEEENSLLKKKVEEMELKMKYMPEGEGYYEAKKHFETLL